MTRFEKNEGDRALIYNVKPKILLNVIVVDHFSYKINFIKLDREQLLNDDAIFDIYSCKSLFKQ